MHPTSPKPKEEVEQERRTFLSIREWRISSQQWSSTHHRANRQISHVFRSWSGTWSTLHKFERNCTTKTPPSGDRTSSTPNSNSGWQHNSILGVVKNTTIQPNRTNAMDMIFHWLRGRTNQKQFRMESRTDKQWRLHNKTSSNNSSQVHLFNLFNSNAKAGWISTESSSSNISSETYCKGVLNTLGGDSQ